MYRKKAVFNFTEVNIIVYLSKKIMKLSQI